MLEHRAAQQAAMPETRLIRIIIMIIIMSIVIMPIIIMPITKLIHSYCKHCR